MARTVIGVVGPGEGATAEDLRDAEIVGGLIAREGWSVLTGGVDSGVMHAALRGARDAGGLRIAVLPGRDARAASPAAEIVIVTGLGEARNNVIVLSSAALVVCGMSAGTASEVALALRGGKPVILVRPRAEVVAFFGSLGQPAPRIADRPEAVPGLLRDAGVR